MKWNLIIMLLYSFMWKLQNSPNQNTKSTEYEKWNEIWLLCFYTHSCESFKIVQIKIQKGQSIRNERKPDYYAFILIHVKASKIVQIKIQKGQIIRNEMKPDYYAFILIHVKDSK